MTKHTLLLLVAAILALTIATRAAEPADTSVLDNLYKPHPRLFIHGDDLPRIRQAIQTDPLLKEWHDRLLASAARMLRDKPIEHVLIGPRLLDKSRTALNRISTLAGLYLIDGDKRFAERAKLEMLTAAGFKDWNPSHFLDVAEMSNAMGIGYDWLYDYLTPDERVTFRKAIIELGLKQGLPVYEKNTWWAKATHNWSQVCNGGLTVGALAIADEEPAIAARIINYSRVSMLNPMKAFAPDGGFPEGPGYWGYATIYNVYYLAAIESALKTDFGLDQMPGFARTGFYRMDTVGPIGRTFNYADAGDRAGSAPQMLWLARTFNQPLFAAHELEHVGNPGIFHLIWYYQLPAAARSAKFPGDLPLDALYRGVNVAFFRSAWGNEKALFVGIKGGDNRANHSHLDLGSFVFDALGKRWAEDLGSDDYNLPGYFGNKRWTYYRLRTESHNTLTLDGENQNPSAKAPIIAYLSSPERAHAVIDLSDGYSKQATQVLRGLAMLNRSQVLVQDQVQAKRPVDVVWNFLTPSKIEIAGQTATLTQGSEKLTVRILSPQNAIFQIVSANPPRPQKQQPGVQNLTVRLPEKAAQATIAVLLTPGQQQPAPVNVEPLEKWTGALGK
jgi:hypothetical protein